MRTVNVGINELHGKVLWLGYVGENEHTQIVLDCTPVFSEYPAAVPAVTVQPPHAQPYPAIVSRDGNNVVWFITDSDLIHCGKGEMQVTFTENGVVVKSRIVNVSIGRSIEPTGVVPEPIENWLVEANTALNAIPQTINDALEGAKESGEFDGFSPTATVSKIGDTATISITDKEGTTTAQVKDGAKGDPGTPGQDGFSPIATVTKSDDTATISITDKNGTTTATVKDGKDGTPGQDGYSPTATVTKSGSVATISITDENGTTTATVTDGQDGDTGATPVISIGTVSTLTPGSDATASMDTTDPAHPVLSLGIPEGEPGNATIDDTSTANNRVWSAQKVNGLLGAVPSGKTLQGQVSDLKSAFDNTNKYLFPDYFPQSWVSGYYTNASTGARSSAPSWSGSDFFKVIPGSKIRIVNFAETVSSPIGIAFYDTNISGAFISGSGVVYESASYAEAIVPANAKYCRISVLTTKLNTFGFSQEIEPWINFIDDNAGTAFDKTGIIVQGKNLFNKNAVETGKYIGSSGNTTPGANYSTSEFIPVEVGKNYQIVHHFNAWMYNSSKTPLRALEINSFVPVSGDAYIRISVKNTDIDTVQVEEGDYVSKFQSYGYKLPIESLYFDDVSSAPLNMYNPDSVVPGYLNSASGKLNSGSNYRTTPYIKVEANDVYTVYGLWGAVCLYASDGTFSRSIESYGVPAICTFSPGLDETLVRFTSTLANVGIVQFEKGLGWSKYTDGVSGVVLPEKIAGDAYKTTHIYVGSDCYFTTINAANDAITDNTEKNRYIIHILKGTYNETFRTKNYVDYIGDNKHQCIINYISDDESDYVNRSTIFAETNSRIANLTIRTTGSKYPIHADANYGSPYTVTIEDCIIKHDGFVDTTINPGGTGIGIGLHYKQNVTIRRCVVAGTSNVFGVASVYCHNDNENNTQPRSRLHRSLIIENCILQDSYYGVRWQGIETVDGQDNDFTYIGNVNTCHTPFFYEPGTYDSWHYFGLMNDPEYTPNN